MSKAYSHSQGPQGAQGLQGAQGSQGLQGAQGPQGAQGAQLVTAADATLSGTPIIITVYDAASNTPYYFKAYPTK
jgi:hypothetical protein